MNIAKAPLFKDPLHNGAADPVVIYNREEKSWWMMYTNRVCDCPCDGVAWVHGTDIGIAESKDGGKTWLYRGIAEGLNFERGRNTYWAPEVIFHEGVYHMYVSYVRGMPDNWAWGRSILHYTSKNLWDWSFEKELELSSDKVIDACIYKLPGGKWRMWFKDERHDAHTWAADSDDLYNWTVVGEAVGDCAHEGANVFKLGGQYWMITDEWRGLGVYSSNDCDNWTKQNGRILDKPGNRPDDGVIANHADVVVKSENEAYIFYFTHPERGTPGGDDRRSSIQVARLTVKDGLLTCDRDEAFDFCLDGIENN